jgi:hypothetical protein
LTDVLKKLPLIDTPLGGGNDEPRCETLTFLHSRFAALDPSAVVPFCSQKAGSCEGFRMPAHRNVSARSEAGVREPPGKEPAMGDVAVAVYGDLTAGRLSRVMRQSVEKSAGSDDENTLSVMWHFSRVPREREPYVQNSIPTWQGPIADPATGRWITSHVMNQDFV